MAVFKGKTIQSQFRISLIKPIMNRKKSNSLSQNLPSEYLSENILDFFLLLIFPKVTERIYLQQVSIILSFYST